MASVLLTTVDAARKLKLSTERVRQLADAGLLRSTRTLRGQRLYASEDVERLARERAARARRPAA
jgi:excisionase family DNA binding protein